MADPAAARVEHLLRTTSPTPPSPSAEGLAPHAAAAGGSSPRGAPSVFDHVPLEPPDAIFGIANAFKADPAGTKVDLVVGAYRTDDGKPWVLPSVQEAERRVAATTVDHEYLPIDGLKDFTRAAAGLLFGQQAAAMRENRVVSVQSLSGSGALRLGADLLAKFFPGVSVIIPDPTWANHRNIFSDARIPIKTYRYYNSKTITLDIDGMLADLEAAPSRSIVLLHVCAHNPTGVDPTREQWAQILRVVRAKQHFPFFDSAYQGFATGDLDGDAYSVRLFEAAGVECLVAQSFAKNMGLYGERTGCLHVIAASPTAAEHVRSQHSRRQLKRLVRGVISSPPIYGARIAATILNDPVLYQTWVRDVQTMAGRIKAMREALYNALVQRGTPGSWTHITSQIGMFTFSGLTAPQCDALMQEHHVYLLRNGRISMAGLNSHNVNYVADAIRAVVTKKN